jgi:hypothetical protein
VAGELRETMETSIAAKKASLNESFSVLNFMCTSVRKRLVVGTGSSRSIAPIAA